MPNQFPNPNSDHIKNNNDGDSGASSSASSSSNPPAATPPHQLPPGPPPPPSISPSPSSDHTLTISVDINQESQPTSSSAPSSSSPIQETAPQPSTLGNIFSYLSHSKEDSHKDFIAALLKRCFISHLTILDPVLNLFFTNPPTLTTTATFFLSRLSSEEFYRFDIANHSGGACISRLLDTLTNLHVNMTPPMAREYAANTLNNLAVEPRNHIPMGSTEGLLQALLEYWLDEKNSKRGREYAVLALWRLLSACEENVERLLDVEEGLVERITGFARMEGNSLLGRTASEVKKAIGRTRKGREELLKMLFGEGDVDYSSEEEEKEQGPEEGGS